jgi:hypothetical protein
MNRSWELTTAMKANLLGTTSDGSRVYPESPSDLETRSELGSLARQLEASVTLGSTGPSLTSTQVTLGGPVTPFGEESYGRTH